MMALPKYKDLNADQCKDSGMALVLITLLVGYFAGIDAMLPTAIIVLLLNMIWPPIYKPFAFFWLGLSFLLGTVMSKVILSLIFFIIVTPVALIRKLLGDDPLKLRAWKKNADSAFRERDMTFTARDVEKPY